VVGRWATEETEERRRGGTEALSKREGATPGRLKVYSLTEGWKCLKQSTSGKADSRSARGLQTLDLKLAVVSRASCTQLKSPTTRGRVLESVMKRGPASLKILARVTLSVG
jgi:hypothetical protein